MDEQTTNVLKELIRELVQIELKKSGLTNFNDEMDARADQKLEDYFYEYDLDKEFTKHCERWIQKNNPEMSRFVTEEDFDKRFDSRISDVTPSR